jgi:hypothetical protein
MGKACRATSVEPAPRSLRSTDPTERSDAVPANPIPPTLSKRPGPPSLGRASGSPKSRDGAIEAIRVLVVAIACPHFERLINVLSAVFTPEPK